MHGALLQSWKHAVRVLTCIITLTQGAFNTDACHTSSMHDGSTLTVGCSTRLSSPTLDA